MSLSIQVAGEEVVLLPERALFWPREATLFIADWHVGKAAAFRAAGMPVPDGDLDEEIARIEAMAKRTRAGALIVLGDFVHAREGLTPDLQMKFGEWLIGASLDVDLITGNHDRSAGAERVGQLGITPLGERLVLPPFVLQHEPGASADGFVLCGHIHPALRLGEGKSGGLRAPCFWFGEGCGVLPAFGGFTGGSRVPAKNGDRLFAVGGGEVIEVPV